jgi:site-specific DNA recombinase
MSPSHTRRRDGIYRYYVTREAIPDGYDTRRARPHPEAAGCTGARLVAPDLAEAKREGEDEITEREVHGSARRVRHGLEPAVPAEQARIVQLLSDRADVQEDALEVQIRTEGLASLVGELRQQGERIAA